MRLKKLVSIAIAIIMMINLLSGCALKDKIVGLKEKDISISIDKEQFKAGWDTVVKYTSSTYASIAEKEYIESVANEIRQFASNVNSSLGSKRDVAKEAGFIAEKWQAATYNINAKIRGTTDHAEVVGSNKLGSVDVQTNDEQKASLKYYNKASQSAQRQSISVEKAYEKYAKNAEKRGKTILNRAEYLDKNGFSSEQSELLKSIYSGQQRIIPEDQFDDAVQYLNRRINKLSKSSKTQDTAEVKRLQEVLDNLRTRLESKNGKVQSKAITYDELQTIAELAEKGEFKPEDFGISVSQLIEPKYIIKTSLLGGASASVLTAALTCGPELYDLLVSVAKKQGFDNKQLKETGLDGLFNVAESFADGALSSAILALCETGKLGPNLIHPDANQVGLLTAITINAIRYGYSLSKGNITPNDYGNLMAENVVTAIGSLASLAIIKHATSISIILLAGSMAGAILANNAFHASKNLVMQVIDGGGFEAIVPEGKLESLDIVSDRISKMGLTKKASAFKTATVSTLESGKIKVFNKKVKT